MGLFSRIMSRLVPGRGNGSPPARASGAVAPEARGGIIARLRQMYRREEPMSEIQLDLCAIDAFGLCRTEGLKEFVISEGWFLTVLPDAMARHGLVQLATVFEEVVSLLPPEARSGKPQDIDVSGLGDHEEMKKLDEAIEGIEEDHQAVVDAIFRDRWAELPEPLELIPGRWGINPFTGERKWYKPKYPL